MLTLAEIPLFLNPRLDRCSHGSHSSAWTTSVFLWMQTWRRSGAKPLGIWTLGPTYLSVPLHRTTCLMSCCGQMILIMSMISPCCTTSVPTRGADRSASCIAVCQLRSLELENRVAISCGLIFWPSLRFFVGWSSASAAKDGHNWPWSCNMILATCLANFWGYNSVHCDNGMDFPWTLVCPAIGLWWWSPWHNFPCRAMCKSTDVEQTAIRLRRCSWESGVFRFPTLHISNSFHSVCSRISDIPGVFIRADPLGCSRSKWFRCWRWYRKSTMERAICHNFSVRCSMTFSQHSRDRFMLKKLHWHHGPHSGLIHTCLGFRVIRMLNKRFLPSVVLRSPWTLPKRWALPPSPWTCLVSSDCSEHITSRRSKRGNLRWSLFNRHCSTLWSSSKNFFTFRLICAWKLLEMFGDINS